VSQTEEPRFERATPADAARVWELQRAAFAEYLAVQDPPPSVWRASVAELGLRIRSAVTSNQALYESLGFSVTDTVLHPLVGPEALTGMEKRL